MINVDDRDAVPVIFGTLIAICVVVIACVIGYCTIETKRLIAGSMHDGADPILAGCAIRGSAQNPLCIARVSQVFKEDVSRNTTIKDSVFHVRSDEPVISVEAER